MEALKASGKAKSIGVSNFSIQQLQRLLTVAKIVPAVNQVWKLYYLDLHLSRSIIMHLQICLIRAKSGFRSGTFNFFMK